MEEHTHARTHTGNKTLGLVAINEVARRVFE